ncbi:MAG TPA: AraC family transcriptional regulator [Firmicutes bacterium]|nr:AraC family transcriptional regulator [Bacillota bacterium]
MDEIIRLGKKFEFDNAYWENPKEYNFINLYQVGELYCADNYEIVEHRQVCHEITCIISGRGYVFTDGKAMKAAERDVFLTKKNQIHRINSAQDSPLRYYYLAFDFNERAEQQPYLAVKEWFLSEQEVVAKDAVGLAHPFSKIMTEMYCFSRNSSEMVGTYIDQILYLTCRLFANKEPIRYLPKGADGSVGRVVYAVIRYVDENIYNIGTILDIARGLNYNSSYLSRAFRKEMGVTLQTYVSERKMEKAVEMLKLGHMTVTQIAQRLNFESVQSFSKFFKRAMGIPPAEYRRACAEGRNTADGR